MEPPPPLGSDASGEPTARDEVRFADVLTTASAVANYLGQGEVTALHVVHAIDILMEVITIDALGKPLSPLVPRTPPGMGSTVAEPVRRAVQRWFAELGANPTVLLSTQDLSRLRDEFSAL